MSIMSRSVFLMRRAASQLASILHHQRVAEKRVLLARMPFCVRSLYYDSAPMKLDPIELRDVPELSAGATMEDLVTSLSPELQKRLKMLQLEYDVNQQTGVRVPDLMTADQWLQILQCSTHSSRRNLYTYLFVTEKAKENDLRKKRKRAEERAIKALESPNKDQIHPMSKMFFFVRPQTMDTYYNSRVAHAMVFGPDLVIDMGFEDEMRQQDVKNLIQQIRIALRDNKRCVEPFNMVFTSLIQQSFTHECFNKGNSENYQEENMAITTEDSFLDLYPREDLIYLSPDAEDVMKKYDYNKVYIVGGLVDKKFPKPCTMAKAKKLGIHMQRLPLDYFVRFTQGSKSMTINHMLAILNTLRATGDWNQAFTHIPKRKTTVHDHGPRYKAHGRR